MFIIMLEVEARQAVIWLPFTKNSVHCMILYLSWKMLLLSWNLHSVQVFHKKKLAAFESFLFWSTSLRHVAILNFDPYRNARRIVVHTAECLHVVTTSWQHMTHTAVLG